MVLKRFLALFFITMLTACSSAAQTVPTEEVIFSGEGSNWDVRYIYNPELYDTNKINWFELEPQDFQPSIEDLDQIDIEIECRGGIITGNLGEMKTEIEGNMISFLVGTVNSETYKEDTYKITIKYDEKKEVITLKLKK